MAVSKFVRLEFLLLERLQRTVCRMPKNKSWSCSGEEWQRARENESLRMRWMQCAIRRVLLVCFCFP